MRPNLDVHIKGIIRVFYRTVERSDSRFEGKINESVLHGGHTLLLTIWCEVQSESPSVSQVTSLDRGPESLNSSDSRWDGENGTLEHTHKVKSLGVKGIDMHSDYYYSLRSRIPPTHLIYSLDI